MLHLQEEKREKGQTGVNNSICRVSNILHFSRSNSVLVCSSPVLDQNINRWDYRPSYRFSTKKQCLLDFLGSIEVRP